MFFSLMIATFLVASIVSAIVVRTFDASIKTMLSRIIDDSISAAWHRYVTFAAFVVGISGGVRIYALERYITPDLDAPISSNSLPLVLTPERWTLEIYRTIIECLQSMVWMYLIVFAFALIAYVIVRNSERKKERKQQE